MADIRKDNVEIYIRELILKEIGSNSNEEKVLWDRRRQMEAVITWQNVNLLGEYDFSEERLHDFFGIKPPNIGRPSEAKFEGTKFRPSS